MNNTGKTDIAVTLMGNFDTRLLIFSTRRFFSKSVTNIKQTFWAEPQIVKHRSSARVTSVITILFSFRKYVKHKNISKMEIASPQKYSRRQKWKACNIRSKNIFSFQGKNNY